MFEEMSYYDLSRTIVKAQEQLAEMDSREGVLSIGDAMKYRHIKARLNLMLAEKQTRDANVNNIPF